MDFKKAFDLVPRDTLWKVLLARGMGGKVLSSLQSLYAADKACVLTKDGPSALFDCNIGVKQGCPASPLLFGLYLDELERLLEEHADDIDCPRITEMLIAILMFADDIALLSYSHAGLQKQLDILQNFCKARSLTVNVQKTKAIVFECPKSDTPPLLYAEQVVEQVDFFKYLGLVMHAQKGLGPAMEQLCKSAKRAMFALLRRCQQLHIYDPILKCKLFDTLVTPILSFGCELWSVVGSKQELQDLEKVHLSFLKMLLGVPVRTKTLHVLAEFGRFPLALNWMSQAAKYLHRLQSMDAGRALKQAFLVDCRLPANRSWKHNLDMQTSPFMISAPAEDDTDRQQFSLRAAHTAHIDQLQTETSSKASTYRDIKDGYSCEPYISQCSNRHLRRVLAQFRTGSHWLNVERGRFRKIEHDKRTCAMCVHKVTNPGLPPEYFDSFDSDEDAPDPVEDELHAIFHCSAYNSTRSRFQTIFSGNQSLRTFLNQPDCNSVARFLTWIRMMRMNSSV